MARRPSEIKRVLTRLGIGAPTDTSGPPITTSNVLRAFFGRFLRRGPFISNGGGRFLLGLKHVTHCGKINRRRLTQLGALTIRELTNVKYTTKSVPPHVSSKCQCTSVGGKPRAPTSETRGTRNSPVQCSRPGRRRRRTRLRGLRTSGLHHRIPYLPSRLFSHLPSFLGHNLARIHGGHRESVLLLSVVAGVDNYLPKIEVGCKKVICSTSLCLITLTNSNEKGKIVRLTTVLPTTVRRCCSRLGEGSRHRCQRGLLG